MRVRTASTQVSEDDDRTREEEPQAAERNEADTSADFGADSDGRDADDGPETRRDATLVRIGGREVAMTVGQFFGLIQETS